MREGGFEHFEDHQILELLLFYAKARSDTNPLAHELLDTFGSLKGVLEARPEMLTDSVNIERLANHPVKLSRDDIRKAYQRSLLPMEDAERQACLDIWKYYGAQ